MTPKQLETHSPPRGKVNGTTERGGGTLQPRIEHTPGMFVEAFEILQLAEPPGSPDCAQQPFPICASTIEIPLLGARVRLKVYGHMCGKMDASPLETVRKRERRGVGDAPVAPAHNGLQSVEYERSFVPKAGIIKRQTMIFIKNQVPVFWRVYGADTLWCFEGGQFQCVVCATLSDAHWDPQSLCMV